MDRVERTYLGIAPNRTVWSFIDWELFLGELTSGSLTFKPKLLLWLEKVFRQRDASLYAKVPLGEIFIQLHGDLCRN